MADSKEDTTSPEEVINEEAHEVKEADQEGKTANKEPVEATAIFARGQSMSLALFIYWILPILILAVVSRIGVDTEPPAVIIDTKPLRVTLPKPVPSMKSNKPSSNKKSRPVTKKRTTPKPAQTRIRGPTAYQEIVKDIRKRNRVQFPMPMSSSSTKSKVGGAPSATPARKIDTASKQPSSLASSSTRSSRSKNVSAEHGKMLDMLENYRVLYSVEPENVFAALNVADTLRELDATYHDGGSRQVEALEIYSHAIQLTLKKREQMIADGKPTNINLSATTNVPDEIMMENSAKSVDGLLCSMFTSKGKQYFMANMFEKAVAEYNNCIEIEPLYLDAVSSRGSARIILGHYKEAGEDFQICIENDKNRMFNDVFTGMAKVLTAKEDAVPSGWDPMIAILDNLIPHLEVNMANQAANENANRMFAEALARLHHVMFMYHDTKTKDIEQAWHHLETGYKFKMSVLPPYPAALEKQKLQTTKQVFHHGFWSAQLGSNTLAPIFIIGFVRSGSTLLERVLDAHPLVVGTGEDSVFNGRLDEIRNAIVSASMSGQPDALANVVTEMANSVVDTMRDRWKTIQSNIDPKEGRDEPEPLRFADKMLTNYFNVGFIHMLFPKALILHVARNPMDCVFSAFKHVFPSGGLDYTSEFSSVADMYHSYRDVMEHWDTVLPGRVTHVRYEDMVHDMPGMARAIIAAAGLPWDDSVLNFHQKKHAVNTLSTTQVRKGVYKHSLEAWKKYETPLQPLVKLVGDRVKWDLKTFLPTYPYKASVSNTEET